VKIDDIRPDALMAGQGAAMQRDLDWLAQRKQAFVDVDCPACGAAARRHLYEKFGMAHQRCTSCGTQYVSPRPTADMLGAFYAQSSNYAYWARYIFPASRETRRTAVFGPRAAIVADLARRHELGGGTMVEVGAAHGLFCEEIRKLALFEHIVAIEPTPALAQECRELGFDTIESPWERVVLERPASLIANFEVIEHLFDPAAFLRWSHANLVAGGHVLVSCPNIEGFETLLLGAASGAVDHEHLNLFTPSSLSLLAGRCGFKVASLTTPGELDVELVRRALDAGDVGAEAVGPVLSRLIRHPDASVPATLQALVHRAGLSSHMVLLGQKV